jgi:hypothetical protein
LAPVLEEVSVKVTAIARDDLFYSTHELAFGTIKKSDKPATVTNKITVFNQPNFEIQQAVSNGQFVNASVKLASRQPTEVTYDVTATLDPACPPGNWISEITLKTNNPGIDNLRIPVSVNLTTPIAISPEELKLANLLVDEAKEFKVTLQAAAAFKIETVKGGDEIVSVKAEANDSRMSHTLVISVKPKAKGELARTLEILTDNKEMPKISVPFKATVAERK